MNNPENVNVDIPEQRDWLNRHKAETGLSWTDLATKTGIKHGTISVFAGGNYAGDNQRLANEIFRYRQHLAAQAEMSVDAPELPPFFMTPTGRRMWSLLTWAQRGRITLIATGPGTSKTTILEEYRASVSNVWIATMAPSTAGVNNMQIEVLEALGEPDAKGTPQRLSRLIRTRVRGTGGLIAIDEAQHLSEKALEEIRSWHDATGIGICLLGNEEVLGRLEGGSRKTAFARLSSRVSQRLIQNVPSEGDVLALAVAWGVTDEKELAFLLRNGRLPGGLRGITMALEMAAMLASVEGRPRTVADLTDAWAQLTTRQIAA